ncbi:Zinc-type alcohol dehydrogenase-like protein [Lacticaseibacillus paracasei subsp. paracasei Lpp221]|uniref:Zinc-type alcohol dehydrogenase-like protein n=1 Tax=Lacticaseibacillus paracasei subsp. paracasei Lpp123 TaxID=1256201 RepID=A0A829G838_LACPA|nr:NADPH:quinone reductase [Lacticaseibacillus paracasei]EPC48779.1 Zinc-type alcohol dehydrogenase-like protein [Lacticaseibacillus paracasei subsp. paracasei Lpp123]EPC80335.1 Zinc-type alcohol dehydrogenase-like protein [Lacticaseibacillus paracasei subsp. paracasei Lpp221]OUC73746.1 hypothetical protein BWK52_0613c [Lacticaseibacillus paracasei]OUC75176.1 hypothetical protein B4Q23_0257c [Lacticaseibacillus paracasei]
MLNSKQTISSPSLLTKTLQPLNAENLRQAHALVESGHMIGKVVVNGPWA